MNSPASFLPGKPLMPLYAGVAEKPDTRSARPEYAYNGEHNTYAMSDGVVIVITSIRSETKTNDCSDQKKSY